MEKEDLQIKQWSPADMLEITLNEPDDFLKIKETLTRIGTTAKNKRVMDGVASTEPENILIQSCHILHKRGRYFIVHFKELYLLDGKPSTLTANDLARRNTIATLLSDWGLLTLVDGNKASDKAPLRQIKIISHSDRAKWKLECRYIMGECLNNRTR